MKKIIGLIVSAALAALLALPSWAAPTVLQHVVVATSGGGANNVAISLPSATTASGLMVAFADSRTTLTGCTDTGSRVWTQYTNINDFVVNTLFLSVWTAPTGAGGDTPTVTCSSSGSNWIQGSVVEVGGSPDTSTTPISVFATHSQGTIGTTVSIGPTGTSGASELAISFFAEDGGGPAWTAPSGWATAIQSTPLNVGVSWLAVASQAVTAAWTSGTNDLQGGVIVVVKAGSAPVTNGVLISNGHPVSSAGGIVYQ